VTTAQRKVGANNRVLLPIIRLTNFAPILLTSRGRGLFTLVLRSITSPYRLISVRLYAWLSCWYLVTEPLWSVGWAGTQCDRRHWQLDHMRPIFSAFIIKTHSNLLCCQSQRQRHHSATGRSRQVCKRSDRTSFDSTLSLSVRRVGYMKMNTTSLDKSAHMNVPSTSSPSPSRKPQFTWLWRPCDVNIVYCCINITGHHTETRQQTLITCASQTVEHW